MTHDEDARQAVHTLAEQCYYEKEHTEQVTRLALRLFDELQPLHSLGNEDRFRLECAATLHDIGWIEGGKGHHKTALRFIRGSALLPFDDHERLVIGSIARYHRKALPKQSHEHFASLSPDEQDRVRALAAILRTADGLDRTHRNVVRDVRCEIDDTVVTVICTVAGTATYERAAALKKGRPLFTEVFDRTMEIVCQTT